MKRVREVCLGAYAHQDVPFEKLVEELQPERDPSRSPLFQVKFVLQNTPTGGGLELPGLRLSSVGGEVGTAKFDLLINAVETGQGLGLSWQYSTELFEAETIERLHAHFATLLGAVASAPESRLGALSLASPAETQEFEARRVQQQEALRQRLTSSVEMPELEGYRLSKEQSRLWQAQQRRGAQFSHQCAVTLSGELDADRLAEAWRRVVERHEILRTALRRLPGMELPLQVVLPEPTTKLTSTDLRGDDAAGHAARVSEAMDAERRQGFDLEAGRVAQARLLRLSEREQALVLTLSALVADAASLRLVASELAAAYEALSGAGAAGEPWAEGEVLQYADYAEWQHELLASEEAKEGRAYWRKLNVGGEVAELRLPHESQPEAAAQSHSDIYEVTLDPELAKQVSLISERQKVTVRALLLASWQTLLWRITGQTNVLIFDWLDGRRFEEMQSAVGVYARQAPLECYFPHGVTFIDILERVRQSERDATTWQEYYDDPTSSQPTGESLTAGTDQTDTVETDFARGIGFEYVEQDSGRIINYSSVASSAAASGLVFALGDVDSNCPSSPLLLTALSSHPDSVRLRLRFDRTRFTSEGATRLLDALLALLTAAIDAPHSPARDLPAIGATERERLVRAHNLNLAAAPFDAQICAHTLFERQAALSPEAEAVVSGEQRLTFAELNARSNQLARHLRTLGVGPEVLVALCLERNAEMVIAILATLKAGGAYVPIDPAYPAERISFMLADSGARVVLSERKLVAGLPEHGASVFLVDAQREELSEYATDDLGETVRAENLAYVIYTSGSTGRPKGVGVEHRQLSHYLHWATSAYLPGSSASAAVPAAGAPLHSSFSFDLSVTALYLPLLGGFALHLLAESDGAAALANALSTGQGYAMVKLTPAHLRLLATELGSGAAVGGARVVVVGGEQLLGEQVQAWAEAAGQCVVVNEYGPTETVVGCAVYRVEAGAGREVAGGPVPIGRAAGTARLYVLDEWGGLSPEGARGELYIGGAQVSRGYLGRAGLTAEQFVPDEFSGELGARLYRTGDVVRWRADGELEFIGRADGQVKVRGYRVELGEVEAALAALAGVREAAVAAMEEEGGGWRLVGFVVIDSDGASGEDSRGGQDGDDIGGSRGGQDGDSSAGGQGNDAAGAARVVDGAGGSVEWAGRRARAARDELRGRLPEYMVPGVVVAVGRLPLTGNGKVDREALAKWHKAGGGGERGERREVEAAVGAVEEVVCGIFEEVLGAGRVGRGESFFELGGHSLLATQVVSRLQEVFQLKVSLRRMFETPTVAGIAESLLEDPQQKLKVEKTAELLLQLAELSEDDVDDLIDQNT
jgi:amino acid adenylation domain-containing protein